MADNDIAGQWLSFDDNRRKGLLAKMTPEQKRNLRVALENHHNAVIDLGHQYSPPERSGFVGRTLQGLGIPQNREELTKAVKTFELGPNEYDTDTLGKALSYLPVVGPVYRMGESYGQGLHDTAKEGAKSFALKGVLGPVGGGSVYAFGEDLSSGNYSGAAGDVFAALINALTLKGASPKGAAGKVDAITFASGMKKGVEDLRTVLPDIESAAKGKPPKTIGDLLSTVNKAKDDMNMKSGQAMQPIKGQHIVPIGISNRIRSRITPDMIQTAEGRHVETMLKDAATDFEKPWTFEQLDSLRMRWGSELRGYYKMSPAERSAFLKSHPEVAVQLEVVQGIQDIVYPAMDKAAGKQPGFFAGLKQRQSTLIDLQKNLETQADELATESAGIRGAPRFRQQNLSFYAAGSRGAHGGLSLHRLHEVISRPNPEKIANKQLSRSFRGRTGSKALIYSYPVRKLSEQTPAKKKKPGEQLRDLKQITSSNPALPAGEAP